MRETMPSLPFVQDVEGCSKAGADAALPKAGTQMASIYAAIQAHGPLSDHDIERVVQLPINIVCARRNSLVKQGLVESAGTAPGRFGVINTRWRVTHAWV